MGIVFVRPSVAKEKLLSVVAVSSPGRPDGRRTMHRLDGH
jgi:hypothetical protein